MPLIIKKIEGDQEENTKNEDEIWDLRSERSQGAPEIKVTDVTFDEKYEITDHTILGEVIIY